MTSRIHASEVWTAAGWLFVAVKLLAFALQVRMMRGEYRAVPQTAAFRIVYQTGKVTPVFVALCFAFAAWSAGNTVEACGLGILACGVAAFSFWVVRLRKQGRFFGLLHTLKTQSGGN